jgi:hypothetical protein
LAHPANQVKGSGEFYRFYRDLRPGSIERRIVDSGLEELKASATAGKKIQRPQWPPYYVRKYQVTNLWKLDLSRGARMIYTVLSERDQRIVVVLEAFLTHKEYERRFGYS